MSSRIGQWDILLELNELCQEVAAEISQQLSYYRASVYKHETAALVKKKIEQLRVIATLIGTETIQELFHDHDAMCENAIAHYIPGECSLTARTTCLLLGLQTHLQELIGSIHGQQANTPISNNLSRNVQRHRHQLLAMCRQGSRQWAFFQTI